MFHKPWKCLGGAIVCAIALLGLAPMGQAQESAKPLPAGNAVPAPNGVTFGTPQSPDDDLRARIEKLERQNEQLMRALQSKSAQGGAPAPDGAPVGREEVQKIVADYLAVQQEASAKKADSADGYRVGTDLTVKGGFQSDGYLWLYTPNKDFTMHPGIWMQYDNVFWDQSPLLRTAPGARPGAKQGVASGVAANGIGDLEDGTYFRRIRPFVEGTMWETIEYRLILALENEQVNTSGLDEFWVAGTKIPLIGTIRVGHVKNSMSGFPRQTV